MFSLPVFSTQNPFTSAFYMNPVVRYVPYGSGVLLSCWYFEYKNQGKYPLLHNSFGVKYFTRIKNFPSWATCWYSVKLLGFSGIMMSTIHHFFTHPTCDYTSEDCWASYRWLTLLWNSLSKAIWACGLIMFCSTLLVGDTKSIQNFLGAEAFGPVYWVSFMMYLIHIPILVWFFMNINHSFYAGAV